MKNLRVLLLAPVAAALAIVVLLLTWSVALGSSEAAASLPASEGSPNFVADDSWSSGWVVLAKGACETYDHNLGFPPEQYAVEVWFLDTNGGWGINRRFVGGTEVGGNRLGAHWMALTANTIDLCRMPQDNAANLIRVRVWRPPTAPDYASSWRSIGDGETLTFTHGLEVTATDLTVGLWFSDTVFGIHNTGYGGMAYDGQEIMHGAYWHHLTTDTVRVTRFPDDAFVQQVRVVVVRGDPPQYDSLETLGQWAPIGRGDTLTLTHGLNWNPNYLVARAECFHPAFGGIHHLFAGTNHDWFLGWQGSALQNLKRDTVSIVRGVNDEVCPAVRVRVWRRPYPFRIYLPLVVRNL